MTIYDWLASLWRTLVPYAVGFAGVQLARLGITLDDATLTAALTGAFGTVYYALFRLLEQKAGRAWGWFLGLARPPHYPDKHGGIAITGSLGSV
ncbi:hypothetical protein [Streptomyces griseoviridis]|uniref:Holin n=1 Tax=Streptomyces griseoviridis TaxID=45398 RepID=A0ABT9LF49_STRGD|nr:hypothetical protein [Streptomyces griseoviridis]MDP9682353.1 hypothetical protein [Streptomyces griseoviridis]GGS82085.1 hypothetical protein GCM10010240_14330 [Streptomyces griseoviridis]